MPRKNNRDKRYEPRELDLNQIMYGYESDSKVSKPRRKRKDKNDKKIYYDTE